MENNLRNRIYDKKQLTEQEVNELVTLLTCRCSQKTKAKIRSILTHNLSDLYNHGIYERVGLSPVGYCAGQSYPDEIKIVRELILKIR